MPVRRPKLRTSIAMAAAALLALFGCRPAAARRQRPAATDHPPASPALADTTGPAFGDTLLTLDSAAVVLFWTTPVDTLDSVARAEAMAELRATAAWAGSFLESYQIPVHATRAHGVLVRPPGGGRRFVDFRGLDYPFGFVLIDPGYPEQFLTGIIGEDDLRDAVIDYFDLEEADSSGVFRTGWPFSTAAPHSRRNQVALPAFAAYLQECRARRSRCSDSRS
jgi:hypothetical protein